MLIINADDLGCNAQRSHGIFQCFEFGIVTSATIWPNGSDSENAARRSLERKLPVGLHLNLVEEYPIAKPADVETLLQRGGTFHPVDELFRMLDKGAVKREHLDREIHAQIQWAFDHGLILTHVASNYDAHIHPVITQALIPIMERYGLNRIRIPCEEPLPPFGFEIPATQIADIRRINALAQSAREHFTANGIVSTDHFRGHTLLGNASLKNLRHIIGRLPEGTTELMIHPGSPCAYGTPFDLDPQRQTELRMLTDMTVPALLTQKKIVLGTYGDL
ncbi:MAG: ChbG/HpnK family deacetylase [Candidatus Peregrinibacteria bacterium]